MIKNFVLIFVVFAVCGGFWYLIFYRREKRLLNRLQKMVDDAAGGKFQRTAISEEKYSALENSLKQYLDHSLLTAEKQQKQ